MRVSTKSSTAAFEGEVLPRTSMRKTRQLNSKPLKVERQT